MCDPVTIATVGLKVMTTMQEHKSAKAVAQGKLKANEQTRRNSDQAYLNDISKIDAEAVSASRELALAQFEADRKAKADAAQALNLNAGNPDKILQDMAGTRDLQFLDVTRDYETDIFKLSGQETDAYAAQQRRYNSIAPVMMPSSTGAMLSIATDVFGGVVSSPNSPFGKTPSGSGIGGGSGELGGITGGRDIYNEK